MKSSKEILSSLLKTTQMGQVGIRSVLDTSMRPGLRKALDMPATLAEAGISPAVVRKDTEAICRDVLADPCCRTNPVPVDASMIRTVLQEVTGRG